MLKNGTTHKTAFAINEHFELYGSYLNRNCYNETATITLHTLNKHLQQVLPVVAELLMESVFPEEELAIYQQNQKQRLQVNLKKCDFVANRLIDEYVYGLQHPYGKYTSTTDYDNLQREELIAFYEKFYKEGSCVVFVAGKLPADIQQQLNAVFGTLPFNKNKSYNLNILPHLQQKRNTGLLMMPMVYKVPSEWQGLFPTGIILTL